MIKKNIQHTDILKAIITLSKLFKCPRCKLLVCCLYGLFRSGKRELSCTASRRPLLLAPSCNDDCFSLVLVNYASFYSKQEMYLLEYRLKNLGQNLVGNPRPRFLHFPRTLLLLSPFNHYKTKCHFIHFLE